MNFISKLFIFVGAAFILLGIGIHFLGKGGWNFLFLGQLPGDLRYSRDGFKFYFPLTTSLILSVVISLILYLFSKFNR